MSRFSRRAFTGLTLAACVAGCTAVENVKEALPKRNTEDGAARIDARVDATLEHMYWNTQKPCNSVRAPLVF